MKSSKGFSLIELLAATVILGVLITAVLAPLANLFRGTAESSRTLQASTQAQQVLEAIRGQWRAVPTPSPDDYATEEAFNEAKVASDTSRDAIRGNYDRSCFPGVTIPPTTTVVIRSVTREGVASSALSCTTTTPANTNVPVMKRITVTTSNNGTQTTLSIDVPRPPANDSTTSL